MCIRDSILRAAEEEADVVVWDGGNNDFPFYKPDLYIVVALSLIHISEPTRPY